MNKNDFKNPGARGLRPRTPGLTNFFLQQLWGKHLQWDKPLYDDLKKKWNEISQNIEDMATQT